jgi:hypothetical protein
VGTLNELVVVLSAPLLVVFIVMTAHVRGFGAVHWVFAFLASWIAGFIDGLEPDYQPLVVFLGSLSAVLFADYGPGLSDEAKRRLFEPFYTTTLREGGSGLGLSVAHGILRTHGGEIEVVPDTAVPGTCFRVTLPRLAVSG